VTAELKNFFGDKLCHTTIPRNVRLAEAPSYGKPVIAYDARSRGAESYIKLAKELMDSAVARKREAVSTEELVEATQPPESEVVNQ
jgi:chromosome partitioning protein